MGCGLDYGGLPLNIFEYSHCMIKIKISEIHKLITEKFLIDSFTCLSSFSHDQERYTYLDV